ncbi:MAG: hypothetical protein HKN27_08860 [Silicimonas sp.]|nr:hypothetical protein [Silicimonas sp.]
MRQMLCGSVILMSSTLTVSAELATCDGYDITVSANNPDVVTAICDAAAQAQEIFKQCNVPSLSAPLHVDVVEDIRDGCVAMYHCGEGLVEVLSSDLMTQRRDINGAFSFLTIDRYFHSVIVHEITHAAFDAVHCPIDNCVVGSEYVAYAIQVMSLTADERQSFVDRAGLDRRVGRDELSALILYIAPHLFAQKVWTHLSQRDDPCGYIGQITEGRILLDFEVFE